MAGFGGYDEAQNAVFFVVSYRGVLAHVRFLEVFLFVAFLGLSSSRFLLSVAKRMCIFARCTFGVVALFVRRLFVYPGTCRGRLLG